VGAKTIAGPDPIHATRRTHVPTLSRHAIPALAATVLLAAAAAAAAAPAQLPAPQSVLQFKFTTPGERTKFLSLELRNVPAGSTVVARCLTREGRRCKGKRLGKVVRREGAEGTVRIRRFENRPIRAGHRLEFEISNPGYLTQYKVMRVRRGAAPTITTECSQPGSEERTGC
jgi:hypothetical protein